MILNSVETFDQPYAGDVSVTPSGILHMRNIHNGFVVTGDMEGYNHIYGQAMIDTRTGRVDANRFRRVIGEVGVQGSDQGGFEESGH